MKIPDAIEKSRYNSEENELRLFTVSQIISTPKLLEYFFVELRQNNSIEVQTFLIQSEALFFGSHSSPRPFRRRASGSEKTLLYLS